jgi:restriction system protein
MAVCRQLGQQLNESDIEHTDGSFRLVTQVPLSAVLHCSTVSEELLRRLATYPEDRFRIKPRVFEETVAEILSRMGYQVTLTPASGDSGRDVIAAIQTPLGTVLTLVECKRYGPKRFVGPEPVARLWSRLFDEKANLGVVVTTSSFQPVTRREAKYKGYQVSLHDGEDFISWVRKVLGEQAPTGNSVTRWNS